MLTDKIRVEQDGDALEPEHFFSEALGMFPDDTRNIHGDPESTVIYSSSRFGDIRLRVADPGSEVERRLFAHYVWNASLLLAELISGEPVWDVDGESVLELGAGLGLGGIICTLCGAKNVTLSDYPSAAIMDNIRANVARNVPKSLHHKVAVESHMWGDFENAFSKTQKGCFTRIFAADCFWMPSEHENLIDTMLHFLSEEPNSRIFAIAGFHTGRAKLAPFFDIAEKKSLTMLQHYEIDVHGKVRSWQRERDGGEYDVTERKTWVGL